jgi:hypothetical protein
MNVNWVVDRVGGGREGRVGSYYVYYMIGRHNGDDFGFVVCKSKSNRDIASPVIKVCCLGSIEEVNEVIQKTTI